MLNEQVVPVIENRPELRVMDSAVMASGPVPVFCMVTWLVIGALGFGIWNVSVRTPRTVESDPFVAWVKLSTPGAVPVPLSVTGDPVIVGAPPGVVGYAIVRVPLKVVADDGVKTTLMVQEAPAFSVPAQVPPPPCKIDCRAKAGLLKVRVWPVRLTLPVLNTVTV